MKSITDISQLDPDGVYTYADYLRWQFDDMVELLRGKVFRMSPAPNRMHQRVSRQLCTTLFSYFNKKSCEVYNAPFDVRLLDRVKSTQSNKEITTVVQPDICVICDPAKLDDQGCIGAPDLIVEIVSPGNSKKEVDLKYRLYQESGVREYWIVYPAYQQIQQFVLDENDFQFRLHKIYAGDGQITAFIFPELVMDIEEIFLEK